MMIRQSEINRKTKETDIKVQLTVDGTGIYQIDTGIGFLNHMLELFTAHGRFDINILSIGDLDVDSHHTVEDVAITLAMAFKEALGLKRGIRRYGQRLLPMDETLVLCALDLSGRAFLNFDVTIPVQKVGNFDTELILEFMTAFSRELGLNLHLVLMKGENGHHIIEALFKALARALAEAVTLDPRFADEIPSTKGVL
jgi:imidazoleglycerol-phosphate dehydratase